AQQLQSILTQVAPITSTSRRLDDPRHEPNRVVVSGIAVQPGPWSLGVSRQPVGQKRALTRAGGADNQCKASHQPSIEPVEKSRAMHQVGRDGRGTELR